MFYGNICSNSRRILYQDRKWTRFFAVKYCNYIWYNRSDRLEYAEKGLESMRVINRESAEHYHWKAICDGWHFLKSDELSIIAEKIPPQTSEDMHYHCTSRQFFYILSGEAVINLQNGSEKLIAGMGIEIAPMEAHQMTNISEAEVEFIVISMPEAHGDKVIISE